MEAATYHYQLPGAHQVSIHFVPELYSSHVLELITSKANGMAPLAMDIETTGLLPGAEDFKIRTIQVGTMYDAWVIPDIDDNIDLIYDALIRGTCPIVTQGGVFDWVSLMVEYGEADLDFNRLIDTKIKAHHWDPRKQGDGRGAVGHSLEALIKRYHHPQVAEDIKSAPTRIAKRLKISKQEYFATVPLDDEEFVMYAGMDTVETLIINNKLDQKLNKSKVHSKELLRQDHEDFYYCIRMGVRSMKVDRPYFETLGEQYLKKYEEHAAAAREHGITALGSSKQLAAKFIEEGFPPKKRTKPTKTKPNGDWSVDKVELQRQADRGSELAQHVIDGKRAKNWHSRYILNILAASSKNGRVYPKTDPLGARTGRFSVSGPALQQLPSHVNDIRQGFVADEGCAIISIDYQGQELRLLAALSGDTQLREDLDSGKKPAKILAARIHGDDYTDDQYVRTKNVLYGMLYGGGAKTLSEQGGISIQECQEVMDSWWALYPGTAEYAEKLRVEAGKQGYVIGIAGRALLVDSDRIYSAVNYVMQNAGRELIAQAIRHIARSRWAEYLRLSVHDELVLMAPTEHIDDLIREVSAMMDAELYGVHFPVEAEVCGDRWVGHYDE